MISDMASGQPGWLAWIDNHAASALSHDGLTVSIVLATALIIVAAGVCLPTRARPLHRLEPWSPRRWPPATC